MSGQPIRIRRSREKGYRTPPGTIYTGRGSQWGNPFALGTRKGLARVPAAVNEGRPWEYESRISAAGMDHTYFHPDEHITLCAVRYLSPAEAVACYRSAILGDGWPVKSYTDRYGLPTVEQIRDQLAGRNLSCWCAEGKPCHADWLLAVANGWEEPAWLTCLLDAAQME